MKRVMLAIHEKFITDKNGRKTAVVLDLKEFNGILTCLEDAYDTRLIKVRIKSPLLSTDDFRNLLKHDGLL